MGIAWTRRRVLAAGGLGVVALAVGAESWPRGRRGCGVPVPSASAPPGPLQDGRFHSGGLGRQVAWTVAWPPGHRPGDALPVCALLHPRGGDHRSGFEQLQLHRHLAEELAAGRAAPYALAAVDGGDGDWHPSPGGDSDPVGMLLEEFLPLLAGRGLGADAAQVGLLGWSSGGSGALRAAETAPRAVAAVVASSAELWTSWAAASAARPGRFADEDDWRRNDVIGHAGRLAGVQVRVDCGSSDPFARATLALAARLPPGGRAHLDRGCHDPAFWRHQAPAQLRFLSAALAGR
jgi:enterochelin esterase-like enzyme